MELLLGGDLVPTNNINMFRKGDINALLGRKLSEIWFSADMRIFNLEVPLNDKKSPINKKGPNLIASTESINGIEKLKPTLITLANNHILDHGDNGLYSTLSLLKHGNIPSIGAGDNLHQASKPYILEKEGMRLGVYTCAENEFTIATDNSPGANPFDPLESLDHIEELKRKCHYVIVLYHGGKEHYRYPSPYLQKVCRKIVDKGADLVVCQHSHCIGAKENYNNSTIVYGQGNFIFNKHDNEYWNTSLLIEANFNEKMDVNYIPVMRTPEGVKLAEGNKAEEILNGFNKRTNEIKEDGFIEREYQKFSQDNINNYKRKLAGFGKWKSRFDRRIFKNRLIEKYYSKQDLLALQNFIECEAHRELILEGIKTQIRES